MTDSDSLTPTFSPSELSILEGMGSRHATRVGEYLYRAGDTGYDFFVVLAGQVNITLTTDGEERLIASHGPGRFLGELNLLTGLRVFVDARVIESGEVLTIPVANLRRIIATQAELSDKVLAAFMARRSSLITDAASATRVIGSQYSPECTRIREFLSRTGLPYEWLDPDSDPQIDALLQQFQIVPGDLPVVISSGVVLRRATPGTVAEYLGLTVESLPGRCFDLVVVGGGPAGLAAAVYGASEGLRTLGLDMTAPGGQAGTSSRIENYFGFPLGISGSDLAQRGLVQAEKFGASLTAPCMATSLAEMAGHFAIELSDGSRVAARAVIAASGASYRRLEVGRLGEFEANSVYYAATDLEARECAGDHVVVVGGGNSAGQAALFLASRGSPVAIVIRGTDLNAKMSSYLVNRIESDSRITVYVNSTIAALNGEQSLRSIQLETPHGAETVTASALFSFVGADPASQWLSNCVALDDHGFVLTDRSLPDDALDEKWTSLDRQPLPFETSRPGLFAVGDVRSGSTKRVAAAVGEGSAAVRSVHEHLAFVAR